MNVPTPEEIVSQVNAERHFAKTADYLAAAQKELQRMHFNIKYEKAEINKALLHALRNGAMEIVALLENLEGGKL